MCVIARCMLFKHARAFMLIQLDQFLNWARHHKSMPDAMLKKYILDFKHWSTHVKLESLLSLTCQSSLFGKKRRRKELIILSLHCLLPFHYTEKIDFRAAQIWSSNDEVCNIWVIRLPHSPSLHVCKTERERETAGEYSSAETCKPSYCADNDIPPFSMGN